MRARSPACPVARSSDVQGFTPPSSHLARNSARARLPGYGLTSCSDENSGMHPRWIESAQSPSRQIESAPISSSHSRTRPVCPKQAVCLRCVEVRSSRTMQQNVGHIRSCCNAGIEINSPSGSRWACGPASASVVPSLHGRLHKGEPIQISMPLALLGSRTGGGDRELPAYPGNDKGSITCWSGCRSGPSANRNAGRDAAT